MAELAPLPFAALVRRMREEVERAGAIFDLPVRKWWRPDARDRGARHFGRRAATPVGPAAGPHTQLAQNIVLSWLAGSRIIELKTVQVNDELRIPRPCIHVPNVGYNVEWSQELRVPQSLREYAKAAYLIAILTATRAFGAFDEEPTFDACCDTIYDISVGYDLQGIRSDKVRAFLHGMRHSRPLFAELRSELSGKLAAYRDLPLPGRISDCVTLSTFHGCPAEQIEAIARHLIEREGLHTIIKLNPTLLGYERVHELLIDQLGYRHLRLRREAFEQDLQYEQALEILHSLRAVAPAIYPTQTDPYMYLSGPPLHVISMNLMQRFREEVGFELPVSFSAGIDARNFADAVACGMVPVTTCTDLLKQGGYGRLPPYLRALGCAMQALGVRSREAYVLAARGHGAEAVAEALTAHAAGGALWRQQGEHLARVAAERPDELPEAVRAACAEAGIDGEAVLLAATRIAGRLNGRDIVPPLAQQRAYAAAANSRPPRRIDSVLERYDCINCDLCIAACPNDAIFAYAVAPRRVETARLEPAAGGERGAGAGTTPGAGFSIGKEHQLAVFEAACNECSNCEVYCPEQGAPFRVKERFFASPEALAAATDDGFAWRRDTLHARVDGLLLRFRPEPEHNRATASGEGFHLKLRWEPFELLEAHLTGDGLALDTAALWRLRTVWESVYRAERPNMARLAAG